ncbi:MAG: FliM/FliN family flagellar motor C-terminal domain-containing protein [Pseudomonadota bacterium]
MAQTWLPDTCLTTRRAAQPIKTVVQGWASDWFKHSPWQVLGNWDEVSPQASDNYRVLGRAKGLEITGEQEAEIVLALAVLGADGEGLTTGDDKDLATKLGKRAIKDLEERITQFLPLEADSPGSRFNTLFPRVFSLLIGPLGKAQIALECSLAQLVAMTLATYPQTGTRGELSGTKAIVDELSVDVCARLGSASITLKELAGLEKGDLLLLDSKPNDPAELMIEGGGSALSFVISETGTHYTLEFQEEK